MTNSDESTGANDDNNVSSENETTDRICPFCMQPLQKERNPKVLKSLGRTKKIIRWTCDCDKFGLHTRNAGYDGINVE